MRRTMLLVATMILTLLVASGVALATAIGSAQAANKVVGPGESIQKAINAAHPGDTIIVRGVHKEDVVIRKDGIKLRGDDAVIEAPPRAKADSPCSKVFGPEGVCVLGDDNLKTLKLEGQRVSDVSVSGFTFRDFNKEKGDGNFAIDVVGARNATITGNRVVGNVAGGIDVFSSVNSTVAKNHVIGNPETDAVGIVVSYHSRNTKILNNEVPNISEGENAIEVNDHSVDTTIAGNDLENNVAGVLNLDSPGTTIISNDISRSGIVGTYLAGQKSENAKVVGNRISGGPWGIYVEAAHGGSVSGNQVHDNCAGMFFEAVNKSQPVGGFEVKGNTVADNTRACQTPGRRFSGIGIALLGATEMEVTA